MELWCINNPSICKMSEPFQSTSYTDVQNDSNARQWTGDQSGAKPGLLNKPFIRAGSIGTNSTGGPNCIGSSGCELKISTDSSILNLLPNRDPTAVARFMAMTNVSNGGTPRFGYAPTTSGVLGSTIKRIGFRWYAYYDPSRSWTVAGGSPGNCNAKIAHASGPTDWAGAPLLTMSTSGPGGLTLYSFQGNTSIGERGWRYNGVGAVSGSLDGFVGAAPGSGASVPSDWNGNWIRHEVTIRRPIVADNAASGFDLEHRTTDVTNGGSTILAMRLSDGCSGCMSAGGPNFSWNTTVNGLFDVQAVHTEYYGSDCSNTTGGFLYAAVAWWTTDAGTEFIGAASEVEGGASGLTIDDSAHEWYVRQAQTNPLRVSKW